MTAIIVLVFLIILTTALSYYEAYFRILSRVKIRRMFYDGDDPENQEKNTTRVALLEIVINFAIITIHMAIVLTIIRMLPSVALSEILRALIALSIGALVVGIFHLLLPGLIIKKDRNSFTIWEINFLKLPYFLLYPIIYPIRLIFFLLPTQRSNQNSDKINRPPDELETLIDVGEQEGLFAEAEGELLHSVVEFSETVVREVMTPRTDIVSIQIDHDINELRNKFVQSGHSRIPVYKKTIDEIVGIVHVKDLIRCWETEQSHKGSFTIEKLLKPPYFIPETKRVDKLLREFQADKIQIAIVVDEYGGVEGLVTIEDLIEVIVGEIKDEYDQEPDDLVVETEQSILVNAKIDIEEVEEYFKVTFPEDDFETIGGFIFHQLGKVPAEGDEVLYNNLLFHVVKADERRIHMVRITIQKPQTLHDDQN